MKYVGNLTITEENAHSYTLLEEVGGRLYVASEFNAPKLTSVDRWLYVNSEFSAPNLTSVDWLYVRAEFSAPKLTSVDWLYVNSEFNTPNLTSVGHLEVNSEFNAPSLTSVDRWLYVNSEFNTPNLTSVGHLEVNAEFSAPKLTSVEGETITYYKYLLNLRWPVLVTDNYIRIGCQRHTKAQWAGFSDAQINLMDRDALEFWTAHKETILSM